MPCTVVDKQDTIPTFEGLRSSESRQREWRENGNKQEQCCEVRCFLVVVSGET